MFASWQAFYELTGEAAATLTGLVFVVTTLTAGRQPTTASANGVRLFTTPTVLQLASVLVISALALAPDGESVLSRVAMTVWSAGIVAYAAYIAIEIRKLEAQSHWSDFWWYGFWPAVTYAGLTVACALAWTGWSHAAFLLAIGLLIALLIAIRNAWDLATFLANRREGA